MDELIKLTEIISHTNILVAKEITTVILVLLLYNSLRNH